MYVIKSLVRPMVDEALLRDRAIATSLCRTWHAFFQRWGRLTDVQRLAVPPILSGRDVLVCSATASGKTESVCAPLAERLLGESTAWTMLYVSPTRALVNDLFERLDGPLHQLDVALQRRTGEYRQTSETERRFLITTPESLDSMLCRGRRNGGGHALQDVRAVVLDEIHLLDGTARGEQLQYLLERLQLLQSYLHGLGVVAHGSFQRVALSATVPDPSHVMDSYLTEGAALVEVAGGRSIEQVNVGEERPRKTEREVPAYVRALDRPEKLLVFADSRRRVEELCAALEAQLEPLGYLVRAHHGSLSKHVREATEAAVHESDRIVVVSTSTLEIGVDIGDIDLVVLDGPPPSISALLQRIGRGNRRTDRTRVMACFATEAEALVQDAMLEAAAEGYLGPRDKASHHAVMRQQIASYLFQSPRPWRSRSQIVKLASLKAGSRYAEAMVDEMLQQGELERVREDGLRLTEYWVHKTERGDIHSNIEGVVGATIVDDRSGKSLASGVNFGGEGTVQVGGRAYSVVSVDGYTVRVRPLSGRAFAVTYATGRFRYGANWAYALRRYLRLSDDHWPVVRYGGKSYVLHFGGVGRKWVLELLMTAYGRDVVSAVTNLSIVFATSQGVTKPSWAKNPPSSLDAQVRDRIGELERHLGLPKANRRLPPSLRRDDVRTALGVDDELRALRESVWTLWPDYDDCPEMRSLIETESRN